MSSRFVNKAAIDEITLSNGDTVQVRQRLTAEEDAMLVRNLMRMRIDAKSGEIQAEEGDWHLQRIRICEAYLLGWSFTDDAGQPVPFDVELVKTLDQDSIAAIAAAIDQLQAARKEVAEKNA